MNAQKWNPRKRVYEPYEISKRWFTPLYLDDMEMEVNCAGCGKEIKYGESYTSFEIHNSYGMGYHVCEKCHERESKERFMVEVVGQGSWGCDDE